jgi:hypothetical protein
MSYCEDGTCEACKAAKEMDNLQQKIHERGKATEADYDEMQRLHAIIISQ